MFTLTCGETAQILEVKSQGHSVIISLYCPLMIAGVGGTVLGCPSVCPGHSQVRVDVLSSDFVQIFILTQGVTTFILEVKGEGH